MRAATITVCSIRLSLRIWQSVGKYTRHTLPPLVWSLVEKMLPPWPPQPPLLLPCWESFLRDQTSLLRAAFNGSVCRVEMTTVCLFLGSTDPSSRCTYSIVTRVVPSRRNHQRSQFLHTSVHVFLQRVAMECVCGMASSVSSLAYLNMMTWSPAPTSRSSLPTCCTPLAISQSW